MGDSIVDTIELMLKWRNARDSFKRLSVAVDKTEGEYKESCKNWQEIIKKWMVAKNIDVIPAILAMVDECDKNEIEVPLGLLAAGYELSNKNDFTL